MAFEWSVLLAEKEAIGQGICNTLLLSLTSACFAILLGLTAAIGAKLPMKPIQWIISAYVQFFRNTPLLVQLYFFYKALPFLGLTLPPMVCGMIALSVYTGAYLAEVFRSGIEAIPREQFDGGLSLGFSPIETYLRVILPQALGIVLPPLGNQMTGLVKNSSLVAFITVPDLFLVIYTGAVSDFRYLEFFTLGILLYMGLTLGVTAIFMGLEKLIRQKFPGAAEVRHA